MQPAGLPGQLAVPHTHTNHVQLEEPTHADRAWLVTFAPTPQDTPYSALSTADTVPLGWGGAASAGSAGGGGGAPPYTLCFV